MKIENLEYSLTKNLLIDPVNNYMIHTMEYAVILWKYYSLLGQQVR
jgi:hypothetical protein